MAKCAFIGLGIMGYPMAGHLRAKGHDVCVYNPHRPEGRSLGRQVWRAHRADAAPGGRGRRVRVHVRRQRRRHPQRGVRRRRRVRRAEGGSRAGRSHHRLGRYRARARGRGQGSGQAFRRCPGLGAIDPAPRTACSPSCAAASRQHSSGQAGHGSLRPRGNADGPRGRRAADQDGQSDLHRRAGPGVWPKRSTSACAPASTCKR